MLKMTFQRGSVNNLDEILEILGDLSKVKTNKRIVYYNEPIAFDIEASSFYDNGEKVAIMYEWTFCFRGLCLVGRRWSEFIALYNKLVSSLDINISQRIIVYVHNLSYDFQFMRKLFNWYKVFSLDNRKPIQAITNDGVEFRCSYILSGYSLKKLGEQLVKYKVSKLVGDLDYDKIRTPITPLTKKELGYCINDVLVVVAYIQETIERVGDITRIPLTKTGYVRDYCRRMCFYGDDKKRNNNTFHNYRRLMKLLTINEEDYLQLQEAFGGGFTHANPLYSDEVIENVHSFDFTSSYPYVMISEKFPMSKPEKVKISSVQELDDNLKYYCCLFNIHLFNVRPYYFFENYISASHCRVLKNPVLNNGRVAYADELTMTVTEQDYAIIRMFYSWDDCKISNFKRFKKGYLPKNFVLSILKLYVDKTQLKGVAGKEVEYLVSKENLNSCYGMAVTDICREVIEYNNEWEKPEKPDIKECVETYNKSVKRFLFYPWGVWVTAYARRNLFTGILEFKDDYVYSDTDSIKCLNIENHMDYIKRYNERVELKLRKSMDFHKIDYSKVKPKNKKGEEKLIGIWDYEGKYDKFKTLGAKRYLVKKKEALEIDGKTYDYSLTVSGVNKIKAIPYLLDKYGDNIFEAFSDELHIPNEYTGKMTHTYIDDECHGVVKDYLGVYYEYDELSCVHLENASYDMSIAELYARYIRGVKEIQK